MGNRLDISEIASALVTALPDDALDELARRVASRRVQPALLERSQAAEYLGLSADALRKNASIRPIYLPDCSKPLYRVTDLDRIIARASNRNGRG